MTDVVNARRLALGRKPSRVFAIAVSMGLLCSAASCARRPLELVENVPSAASFEYDLVEAFPLAEAPAETSFIDIGTPQARPHLVNGWSRDERRGRGSYVWAVGEESEVRWFVSEPRDVLLQFQCWPFNFPEGQSIRVLVNDHEVAHIKMSGAPQTYTVPIPTKDLVPGWNRAVFRYAQQRKAAPDGDARPVAVAFDWLRFDGLRASPQAPSVQTQPRRLRLPFGTRVDYYLKVFPETYLSIDEVDGWNENGRAADDAALQIELQTAFSGEVQRFKMVGSRGRALRLPVTSPQVVRLSLLPLSLRTPATESAGLSVLKPTLFSGRAINSSGVVPQTSERTPDQPPPPIVIYLVDTLRADHLGCYGYARPTSPNIDRFARDGTLFTKAIAQASWTRPAVASLFTGLNARTHGVNQRKDKLPAALSERALPTILQRAGYHTAAFITNSNVGHAFGFRAGFDTWVHLREQKTDQIHHYSDEVNEEVFAWLDGRRESQPFHLYIHTVDPHGPYTPRSPYREQFAPGVPREIGLQGFQRRLRANAIPNKEEYRLGLQALYDAEIAFNDAQFGKLLDKLKELGLYESALIVLVSDHGEEFNEHNGWGHGETLFGEQLNVPLIIKFPHGWAKGRTFDGLARQIDVMPTILSYLGQTPPAGVQGRNLLPLPGANVTADDGVSFAHMKLDSREMDGVTLDGYKLIHTIANNRWPPGFDLYDVRADPNEQDNLFREQPIMAGYLNARLRENNLRSSVAARAEQADVDPATEERLRALGYVH